MQSYTFIVYSVGMNVVGLTPVTLNLDSTRFGSVDIEAQVLKII